MNQFLPEGSWDTSVCVNTTHNTRSVSRYLVCERRARLLVVQGLALDHDVRDALAQPAEHIRDLSIRNCK